MIVTYAYHVGLAVTLLTIFTRLAEQPDASEDVPVEAQSAWDQFAEDFAITRLVLVSETRNSATAEFRLSHATVKCYENKYLMVWDNLVKGVNDKYGFELRRSATDRPWTLTSLVLRKGGDELKELEKWVARQKVSTHLTALVVGTTTLNKLAQHHGFSVTRVQSSNGEPNLVCLDFEIEDHGALIDNYPIAIKRGRLTLDPSRSWLPVRRELVWPKGEVRILELQSFKKAKGVEYPSEMRATVQETDGSEWLFQTDIVKELQIGGSVPNREFMLSYFGFPEPVDSGRRFPSYLWLALVAAVMIALGMLLRARSQARNA